MFMFHELKFTLPNLQLQLVAPQLLSRQDGIALILLFPFAWRPSRRSKREWNRDEQQDGSGGDARSPVKLGTAVVLVEGAATNERDRLPGADERGEGALQRRLEASRSAFGRVRGADGPIETKREAMKRLEDEHRPRVWHRLQAGVPKET